MYVRSEIFIILNHATFYNFPKNAIRSVLKNLLTKIFKIYMNHFYF